MNPKSVYILLLSMAFPIVCKANRDSVFLVTLDLPAKNKEGKITQRVNYRIPHSGIYSVQLLCSQIRAKDTLVVYDLAFDKINFSSILGFIDLHFSQSNTAHQLSSDYSDIITRFDMVPAGQYISKVILRPIKDTGQIFQQSIYQDIDSNLIYSSGLKDKVNVAMLLPQSLKQKLPNKTSPNKPQPSSTDQLKSSNNKLQRKLRNIKHLHIQPILINNQAYSALYYKSFFLGRYPLASAKEMSNKAANEIQAINSNVGSLVNNELEGYRSVSSQVKDLFAKTDKNNQLKANIDLNTFSSNTQDPQSAIEPNYTELLANVDVEFMGMPFSVEGFYTTQDANRKAKSSYVRFHYDIETAKAKLQKNINSYKSKLEETVSKGQGLENVYGNYAKRLDAQKESMLKDMAKEYDLDPSAIKDSKGNIDQLTSQIPNSIDTGKLLDAAQNKSPELAKKTQSVQAKKEKILKNKKDIEERYKKIEALEQKAHNYYALLEKYRNQTHLDSALNYEKLNNISNKDASYKDMTKAAAGILPEGKAKKFITGLTNFDMGIINKYESDYTMAGQTMKGLSMGYDLGFMKAGISAGSTEYVSREGNVEHYSSMLLRVDNKGTKNHKIGFLYNINTPSRAMSLDNNFIGKKNVRYPSFNTPSQIISVVYEGKIKKNLLINSELARSFKKNDGSLLDMAHAALNNSLDYTIPKTSLGFKAAWEHLGSQFENNALPYIRSGTDRYTLGTHFDLFQSFLSVKLDYNYLVQQSFASTGYSTKWGFDIKTHSKRYPSISLSYKPFSTFRTFADTFNIPQRPVQGEVWTARSSYQIKRHKNVHRFTMMYNKNTSTSDSFSYSSSTAQLGYIYTCPAISVSASFSRIELPNNFADGSGIISSYISSLSVNKTFFKSLSVSLSPDMSNCTWGLQRISGTVGLVYRMNNKPLLFRTMFRYSKFKLNETAEAQELYAGQMGMNWQFKATKKKKVILN
ncbi:MAG: hypothetical protein QM530_11050 [Phycisphaerales bacterium]|nr:hypothetical protein [Phycisphaerales bacterium]